ncbi:hypothetical protein [Streptomyces albidoflavus]|uniref:hypothetical protein n=1 Tax=Streptomyces albidoflavus TaxID=1886 RepID=UPI0013EEBA72|nr:hypothetical protein [Streptomyces albidoflavus]
MAGEIGPGYPADGFRHHWGKMKKSAKISLLTGGALLFSSLAVGPASAATAYGSCATSPLSSSGSVNIANWPYSGKVTGINLRLYDEKPDGHHVRIRLAERWTTGKMVYYAWRKNMDGYGTYKSWDTYMNPTGANNKISGIVLQVATFEGETQLQFCEKRLYNPGGA